MRIRLYALVAALLVCGCASSGGEGYNVGFGDPSEAWAVTLKDGSPAWAYWCVYNETCMRRARTACADSFVMLSPDDIDQSRSAAAVEGGFFRRVEGAQSTLVVSCAL